MKVKSMDRCLWLPVVLLMMVITLSLCVSPMAQAAEYESLYPFVHHEVDDCLKSPCDGYIRHITRFVDPAVLSGEVPATGSETLIITLLSGIPRAFRFFIPPGTLSASLVISSDLDARLAFRYQTPPSCTAYDSESFTWDYRSFLYDMASDVYRHGRYITAEDGILPSPDESGWLYIKNLNGVSLTKVRVVIKVDLAEFVAWYKPFMSWDENGDPWSADHGVAPVEVCAPDNLDACNESNCQTDGEGYWYNDVGGDEYCHETPACDGDTYYDCLTESQCLSADGDLYWYEDEVDGEKSCHPVPACKRDIDTGEFVEDCTPVNCITAVQCEDADFFWYEDEVDGEKTCHELRACERNFETGAEEVCSAANCITPDQCTSSNFYWYEDEIGADKYCHEMKSCERNLNTGGEEDCSPDNCITEDQCDDAHFYWYKGEDEDTASCHQEPEQGVCSENNLLACSTEAECVAAGGEWYNYSACVKKRSSSYTPYTPPASSSSPPSTGSGSTAVSGSNWFSFLFATNSAPAPAPVCDAQHLDDCDQTGCAGLGDGYWWYDGACRAEPVQTDFRGHLSSAPVSPGAGADDGVIAAGEGLSFTIDVPADCRLYALLSIPDVGAFFISNEEILTANMVPVAGGTIPVIADICPLLTGEWEFLKGTWTVYTVAVPAAVGESPAQLGAYLEQGGLYALGSYTIEVGCQEVQPQVQPQEQSGYTLYDIPRPSQD